MPLATGALMLCACGDPLVPRQLVVDTRVLAARAVVATEPTRATPSAGEDVLTRVFVAAPAGGESSWQLEACVAEPTTTGVPRCIERVALSAGETPVPELSWALPEATPNVTVVGVVCDSPIVAAAAPWPQWSCAAGKRNLFHFKVATADEGLNDNPTLARDQLRVNGEDWLEDADCVSVAAASEHELTWTVHDDNRESVGDGREELLLSHFTTAGKLERTFSRVASDAAPVSLTWSAPPSAREVTFYFVVRDGRGGVDWTTRTLCVES